MSLANSLISTSQGQAKTTLLQQYKGKPYSSLPTPALLIKKPIIQDNCERLLKIVSDFGYKFRVHVKTHKTIEITKMQLGYDLPNYEGPKYDSIVVSTLKEASSIIDYQRLTGDVVVHDIVYGLPNISDDALLAIVELRKHVKSFRLLIDNIEHIKLLKKFSNEHDVEEPWSVIVKLDAGSARAGLQEPKMINQVLCELLVNPQLTFYGFYVHSGHSYSARTVEEAQKYFLEELQCVSDGVKFLEYAAPDLGFKDLVASVGATPTLHSIQSNIYTTTGKKIQELLDNLKVTLEVHAGNYALCDLQQVSTGCVKVENIGSTVLGTVISQYSGRKNRVGELLTNTGVIALSRETSPKFPGFGKVLTKGKYGGWKVDRLSQEHGILSPVSETLDSAELIPIGTKVQILPNHSCITANSFYVYYVLNDDDNVIDVYIPWRGW